MGLEVAVGLVVGTVSVGVGVGETDGVGGVGIGVAGVDGVSVIEWSCVGVAVGVALGDIVMDGDGEDEGVIVMDGIGVGLVAGGSTPVY